MPPVYGLTTKAHFGLTTQGTCCFVNHHIIAGHQIRIYLGAKSLDGFLVIPNRK